ncbi:glycosyltransferase [Leifsonia sp. NPDC058248]|uniref:glycosyltransferase n=1 Tax=Leifsonia sp. NPDC058248 TaxID=3346402 RepID=UPI0036D858C7
MAGTPLIDAVIAVHDASRPVARAVRSLTESGLDLRDDGGLRITVVCHNLPEGDIRAVVPDDLAARVRFLELRDGIASAAGPFNAGIDAATAPYVSIMGSDDYFEPGALAAWRSHADHGRADAVIAPEMHAGGATVRTPPTRPFRRGDLDPVKDRLAYRTAPLGLISTAAIARLGLRFPEGLRSGEDQSFSAKLWFGGGAIRSAKGAPHYVVGADAATRVSLTPRAVQVDFAFVDQLLDDPWFGALPLASRRALAVKMVRVHVFAAVLPRIEAGTWDAADHEYLAGILGRLRDVAPGFERPFPIADRRMIDAIADLGVDAPALDGFARARRRFGRPATLVTRDLGAWLSVEGPPRFMVASALV